MNATLEQEQVYEPQTLSSIVGNIRHLEFDGHKYLLDLDQLKTPEDIIYVLKHFSTRVELRVHQIKGIESYVKPISATTTH